jgi:hypothetical protein
LRFGEKQDVAAADKVYLARKLLMVLTPITAKAFLKPEQ